MESPMSSTRGRLVLFACEIQMSHHSMDSRSESGMAGAFACTPAADTTNKVAESSNLDIPMNPSPGRTSAAGKLIGTRRRWYPFRMPIILPQIIQGDSFNMAIGDTHHDLAGQGRCGWNNSGGTARWFTPGVTGNANACNTDSG